MEAEIGGVGCGQFWWFIEDPSEDADPNDPGVGGQAHRDDADANGDQSYGGKAQGEDGAATLDIKREAFGRRSVHHYSLHEVSSASALLLLLPLATVASDRIWQLLAS